MRSLSDILAGLKRCRFLQKIDLQENHINFIEDGAFPVGVRELRLTGNKLSGLPKDLSNLAQLEHLFASANRWFLPSQCNAFHLLILS